MTTLDQISESALAGKSAAIARVLDGVWNFLRALKNRRAVYRLGEMSDAELADIGLTRTDLSVAIGLPFGADPTIHLGTMAEARIRRIDEMARRVA